MLLNSKNRFDGFHLFYDDGSKIKSMAEISERLKLPFNSLCLNTYKSSFNQSDGEGYVHILTGSSPVTKVYIEGAIEIHLPILLIYKLSLDHKNLYLT